MTLSAIGHAASAELAWAPLLLGLGTAGAVAVCAHRPVHGWYALGAAATALWTAAAWWVGLLDPVVLCALLAFGAGGSVAWLRYRQPRAKVVIIGGSRRPWEREAFLFGRRHRYHLGRVVRRWPLTVLEAKVPGVSIRRAEADISTSVYRLLVELRGLTPQDLRKQARRIAVGLQARRMTLEVLDHEEREHLAWIVWARDDAAQEVPRPVLVAEEETA